MFRPGRVKLALHTGKNLRPAGSDLPTGTTLNYKCYWRQGIIIIVTDLQFSLIKTHLMPVPDACALSYTLANSVVCNSFCYLAAISLSGRATVGYQQKRLTKENLPSFCICSAMIAMKAIFFSPTPYRTVCKKEEDFTLVHSRTAGGVHFHTDHRSGSYHTNRKCYCGRLLPRHCCK